MILIQKCKPNLGFLRISARNRIHADLAQLLQRATDLSNIELYPMAHGSLKVVGSLYPRQVLNAKVIQFGQRFATTHFLQSTIGGTPIQPLADPPRQIEPGNGWFSSHRFLNSIQKGSRKMLTGYIHAPHVTPQAPCVKCVQ